MAALTSPTPRTCWRPIALCLLLCLGMSVGLTFVSDKRCYAGTCGSRLFPMQARLHVLVWYCWLATSIAFLTIRGQNPWLARALSRRHFRSALFRDGVQVSIIMTVCWIVVLIGIVVRIWWKGLASYFGQSAADGSSFGPNMRLAAIALTGHFCDITMGMVLLPISRHSAMASLMRLSHHTTLTFHMCLAYLLFALVLIHGLLYVAWAAVYFQASAALQAVFPLLNPTYYSYEVWPAVHTTLGFWRLSLIFTGIIPGGIMLLIFITTWPKIRKTHFNLFYFTHLLAIPAILIVCLHASTMFYCLAPGIIMYTLDWSLRIAELSHPVDGEIRSLGKGWYTLTAELPRSRLHDCSVGLPLAHFFIHHSTSSRKEIHPFTTATALGAEHANTDPARTSINVEFLFKTNSAPGVRGLTRNRPDFADGLLNVIKGRNRRQARLQWTDKLAQIADSNITLNTNSEPSASSSDPEHGKIDAHSATATPEVKPPASSDASKETQVASKADSKISFIDTPRLDLAHTGTSRSLPQPVRIRFEGPYYAVSEPSAFHTTVSVVAGTGLSGALALARAFRAQHPDSPYQSHFRYPEPEKAVVRVQEVAPGSDPQASAETIARPSRTSWSRCVIIWTVREDQYIDLRHLLLGEMPEGFEFRVHLTGSGRPRLDMESVLDEFVGPDVNHPSRSRWFYISGPNPFIHACGAALKKRENRYLDWYLASWEP